MLVWYVRQHRVHTTTKKQLFQKRALLLKVVSIFTTITFTKVATMILQLLIQRNFIQSVYHLPH